MSVTDKGDSRHFDAKISDENMQKLKEYRNALNEYVNLKDGDAVDWEINPNKVEMITNKFGQERVRFIVYDPEFDGEFKWDAPKSAAKQISDMMYQKGTTFFHIERHGAGTQDTRYTVEAAK